MKQILFNTDMVRAILNNRKMVTRRAVKIEHLRGLDSYEATTIKKNCVPPYCPGDILYVRETWAEGVEGYEYKADHTFSDGWGWRPSIHMPREAARIFLRVTDVKVERLQDMQPYDIAFEGFRRERDFKMLWNSTIKPADRALYGWDANPWVWVIEFERITKEEAG